MDQTIVEEALFGEKVYVNSAKNEAKSGRGAGELCQRLPEIRLDSLGLWDCGLVLISSFIIQQALDTNQAK